MYRTVTPEERAIIFSSDVIDRRDVAKLRQISDTTASTVINDIKRFFGDKARPATVGHIDVKDYMEYFGYTWEDIHRDYAFDIIREKLEKLDFSSVDKTEIMFALQRLIGMFQNK